MAEYEAILHVNVYYQATLTIDAPSRAAAEAALGNVDTSDLYDSGTLVLPDGATVDIRSEVMDAEVDDWDVEIESLDEEDEDDGAFSDS